MPALTAAQRLSRLTNIKDWSIEALYSLLVDMVTPTVGTAAATAGAATLASRTGKITSESLSTAAGATYTLTITDTEIAAADIVMASVAMGTATTGQPAIMRITPAAGSVVIILQNLHASAALNGTIVVSFHVHKAA